MLQMHRHLRQLRELDPGGDRLPWCHSPGFKPHRGSIWPDVLRSFAAIEPPEVHLIPTSSDLDQLVAGGRRRRHTFREGRIGVMSFGDHQIEIYFLGTGVLPSLPASFLELEIPAQQAMSLSVVLRRRWRRR